MGLGWCYSLGNTGQLHIYYGEGPCIQHNPAVAEGKEAFFSACSKMNENILIDRNRGALVVNGLSILNLSRISGDLSFSSSPNDFRYSRYSSIAFAASGVQNV